MFSTPHHFSALLVANGPLNIERRHYGMIDFQPALKLSELVTSKSVNLGDFFWTSPSVVS